MSTSYGNMRNSGMAKFYGFDYGYGWELFAIAGKKVIAHPGIW